MKSCALATIIVGFASAVSAAPASRMAEIQARDEQLQQAETGVFDVGPKDSKTGAAGIFGQGGNVISNVFDSATCIVSGFLGGGNPNCKGEGEATLDVSNGSSTSGSTSSGSTSSGSTSSGSTSSDSSSSDSSSSSGDVNTNNEANSTRYTYKYDTNEDGTLKVDVELQQGGKCTYNLKAEKGKSTRDLIKKAAQMCLDKQK
ncbi:hypothetical protein QQS21_001423 [Conoideocrella luteorostrata]|uniref:Uncharacterized protein n=1 Tax=Conoideocrella luteorostrata TaxID=1105319 RepID=A0AAJ0CZS3_9HYPO|nr:hypothetical protein QQS21_001423 [Conoideocrella luteorostrata]